MKMKSVDTWMVSVFRHTVKTNREYNYEAVYTMCHFCWARKNISHMLPNDETTLTLRKMAIPYIIS